MKFTLTYKFFAFALAALVVLSGGGITVFEHICNTSGHADISFLIEDNCCTGEGKEEEKSCEGCCSSNTYSQKVEINASKVSLGEELITPPVLVVLQSLIAPVEAEKISPKKHFLTDHSPPHLQGRYLHFLQSYLI